MGQPYLLQVDETSAAKQRFAMVMLALATGQTISGYDDGCNTGIWADSRVRFVWRLQWTPLIEETLHRTNHQPGGTNRTRQLRMLKA